MPFTLTILLLIFDHKICNAYYYYYYYYYVYVYVYVCLSSIFYFISILNRAQLMNDREIAGNKSYN